jgi:diguanylate cyclase (GGDEF)-like protein/PAS domain S-box-containing protein
MTTAALLRAAARIARAEAALLDVDGEELARMIFGLSDRSAAEILSAIRSGSALPDGREIVCEVAVPLADSAHAARMILLDPAKIEIDESLERTLRLLAIELGHELDSDVVEESRSIRPMLGERVLQLAESVDNIGDPVAIFEAPHTGNVPLFIYVNPAFQQFFGYSALDVLGQTPDVLYGPMTDLERIEFLLDRVRTGLEARSAVIFYKRDELPVWVEIALRPVVEWSGALSYYVVTMRDATARKEFEMAVAAEKRKLQVTLAAIGDGVISTVEDGRIEFVNAAARAMLKIDPSEAYGESIKDVVPLTDPGGSAIDLIVEAKKLGKAVRGEAIFRKGKAVIHIAYVTSPIGNESDGYVVVLRDVTAQQKLATQLSFEASHDPLTGLVNRRKFEDVLAEAVTFARRGDDVHTLAFLDLDRFKAINDHCGHAVGDRVLADIARVLQRSLRERDILARLGGDEFAILLHGCSLVNARRVLEKLQNAVDTYEITHKGERFSVGVSIGLAAIDRTSKDPGASLAEADAACYAAKAAGRNLIVG